MFTVDYSVFDMESKEMLSSMVFFHETTLDESLHTETADEQQAAFVDTLKSGYVDDDLRESPEPQIYEVCPVEYSPTGLAVGIGGAFISNIVLRAADKSLEGEVRAAVLHQNPGTRINVYYRNI